MTKDQKRKNAAQALQNFGRNGDEILAHINPKEAQILKDLGGSGTINPDTGLLEFFWEAPSYSWDAPSYSWEAPVYTYTPPVYEAPVSSWQGTTGSNAGVFGGITNTPEYQYFAPSDPITNYINTPVNMGDPYNLLGGGADYNANQDANLAAIDYLYNDLGYTGELGATTPDAAPAPDTSWMDDFSWWSPDPVFGDAAKTDSQINAYNDWAYAGENPPSQIMADAIVEDVFKYPEAINQPGKATNGMTLQQLKYLQSAGFGSEEISDTQTVDQAIGALTLSRMSPSQALGLVAGIISGNPYAIASSIASISGEKKLATTIGIAANIASGNMAGAASGLAALAGQNDVANAIGFANAMLTGDVKVMGSIAANISGNKDLQATLNAVNAVASKNPIAITGALMSAQPTLSKLASGELLNLVGTSAIKENDPNDALLKSYQYSEENPSKKPKTSAQQAVSDFITSGQVNVPGMSELLGILDKYNDTQYAGTGSDTSTDAGGQGGEAPFAEVKRGIAGYLSSSVGENTGIRRNIDGTYSVEDPGNDRTLLFSSDGSFMGAPYSLEMSLQSGAIYRPTTKIAQDFINAFISSPYAQSFTGTAVVGGSDTGASTGATSGGTGSDAGFWESIGIDPATLSDGDSGLSNDDIMALIGYGQAAKPPVDGSGRPMYGDVSGTFGGGELTGFSLVSEDNNAKVYENDGFTLIARANGTNVLLDKTDPTPEPIWLDPVDASKIIQQQPTTPPVTPPVMPPVMPSANITPAQVEKIVNDAIKANPSLTSADVQSIVSDAFKAAPNLTAEQVKQIVGTEAAKALAGLETQTTEQYNTLTAAQKATADALVDQGKTLAEAIETAKTETAGAIEALSADVQEKYDALTAEQKALADAMSQQGLDLDAAIELAAQQTQEQITGLGEQVDTRINELMQQGQTYQQATQQAIGELNTQNQQMRGLIGTQGRTATQEDVDALSQMLGGQRDVDLAYDVTGDKQITQADIDFLTQVVGGTKTDWTPQVGSAFGPTGLYGQLAANEAQRQADLQAQLLREQQAAAEAQRQAQISGVRGTLARGQQAMQQAAQQLPQAYQQAQQVSTPIYGEMGPYLDIGSDLDYGFFKPSPEKLAATKQQQPTKIASGGYIDDLLAGDLSVDELLNLLR